MTSNFNRFTFVLIYTLGSLLFTVNYAVDGGFAVWQNNLENLYILVLPGVVATISCATISKYVTSSGYYQLFTRAKSKTGFFWRVFKINFRKNIPLIVLSLLLLLVFSYLSGPLGLNSFELTRINENGDLFSDPNYGRIIGYQFINPILTAIVWSGYLLVWSALIMVFTISIFWFTKNSMKTIAIVQILFLMNTFIAAMLGQTEKAFIYSMIPFSLQHPTVISVLTGFLSFLIITLISLIILYWSRYEV